MIHNYPKLNLLLSCRTETKQKENGETEIKFTKSLTRDRGLDNFNHQIVINGEFLLIASARLYHQK